MTQAALFDEIAHRDVEHHDRIAFEIGWDHARHRLVPPAEHLLDGHPVRQGWQAGQAVFGARTLRATPAARQWLQLRLRAWLRGHAFEDLQVTPHFIAQLAGAHCPVTLDPLDEQACIERVFDGAGYAAGNLVALSPRAAAAKACCGWDDALDFARRIDAGEVDRIAGLDAAEWSRLGVLMSLATPLAHARVTSLPLLVLPTNRLRVLNPAQALQTLLTLLFTQPAFARHMADLAALMPSTLARQCYQVFMHTLLARRVAAGPQATGVVLKAALAEAWRHPLVQRRWQRLACSLSLGDCEHLVQLAQRRKLLGAECRWLDAGSATDGWALDTQGLAPQRPVLPRRPNGDAGAAIALPAGPSSTQGAAFAV
jgi:hypothetical protein